MNATFVLTAGDIVERVCDGHLGEAIRILAPRYAEEVSVSPLSAEAGFPCDHCPSSDSTPLTGFGGQDISYA